MSVAMSIVPKEDIERILDVEKLKNCYDCGICTAACPVANLLGKGFNPRRLLERIASDLNSIMYSDELWLCAWCYSCYRHCNQGLKLPEIFLSLRRIAAKRSDDAFQKALRRIVENIPLPLVAVSVCFHPERAGFNKEEALKKTEQMYTYHLKEEKAKRAQEVHEERVAVVGSGPAGLTVAYELSRRGYGVTIFEKLLEPGGMLRKCIPENRLPRQILEKEVQYIIDLGVEIRTATAIGEDYAFGNLWRDGYKAVFIGAGAHKKQEAKIEGANLKGVFHALELLWQVNLGEQIEIGENVTVVGGGNVAMDAAQTVLRLGAKNVTVLYRRSRAEMPAIPWEVNEAESAGVKMEFLVLPKRIIGGNGKITGVECVRTQLGEPDESGRRRAAPIEGSEFKREADMVVLAIGEAPDLEFLPKEIILDDGGTLWVDPFTMETSVIGIFAGGDAVTGPATVIEAICAGKLAAASIEAYLKSTRA